MAIIQKCIEFTTPGIFGAFPNLRVLLLNTQGCIYKKKDHKQMAFSSFLSALKIADLSISKKTFEYDSFKFGISFPSIK